MPHSVMIVETSPSGHRLVYVKLLVDGAIERGLRIEVALPRPVLESPEYLEHLSRYEGHVTVVCVPKEASLNVLQRLAISRKIDRLVVPDSNGRLLQMIWGRRFSGDLETVCLMMRDPRWEMRDHRLPSVKLLLKMLAVWVAGLRLVADLVWLREPGNMSSFAHANDPVLLDGSAQEILSEGVRYRSTHELRREVYWFGIVGMITESKELELVARAVARAGQEARRRTGLALLGPLRASEETMRRVYDVCAEKKVDLVTNFALHSNFEINVAVGALDCVVAAYSKTYGPSSILGKAAALGIASVAAGSKSQQEFARAITGWAGVPLTEDSLAEVMVERMSSRPSCCREGLGPEQFLGALLD